MHILITGGAGFIGSNLARHALDSGHEVRVLDDLSTGFRENLSGLDVDFHEGSLLDESAVSRAVVGVDSIVHLGALGSVPRSIHDPITSHHVNATGTLVLLDQARRADVTHAMCASSSSVYGMNPALPKSEREWVRPMSPYAVTKLATEQYTLAFQQSFGFETVAFRFFNVFGPGQRAGHVYAAVVPTWIDAMLRGEPVYVNGDGSNSRDFTFVETVCKVLLETSVRRVSHPEPVNLAFGTNTNLTELIQELSAISGITPDVQHRAPRAGDVPHSMANNEVLRSLFPDIAPTGLTEGLKQTLAWFESQSHLD
ncbi:NAD-dependent epimerase/dehydratase family protein [Nocardioides dongxiaopingii]|uniref:NAD-dependent epimerase/dehydratase family protein n=1 Tax=Nocardioides sp. S-1144 TaxID=2582905 RepID=UPI0011645663|nr:NAD-dependent epimerase/dehydratase family protein [Nocardioides sp. S-1144]QDH10966.1 NAD-dependent epimerase/dehydratase family protein [Nocardioides sp. S-1144]